MTIKYGYGTQGSETISYSGSNRYVAYGYGGNDYLIGGSNNDSLNGGSGDD